MIFVFAQGNIHHDDADKVTPQFVGQDMEVHANEEQFYGNNYKETISRNSNLTSTELMQSKIKYLKQKSIQLQQLIDDDKHLYFTLESAKQLNSKLINRFHTL